MFSQETADKICEIISTSNKSMRAIAAMDGMPALSTIMKWLSENKLFSEQYARSKELQADFLAEEILEIADDSSNDTIDSEYGPQENKEWVNRSKLRVDARKWVAAKLRPKKYSEKVDITTGGETINNQMSVEAMQALADKINK